MTKEISIKWYQNRVLVFFILIGLSLIVLGFVNLFDNYKNFDVKGTFTLHTNSFDENEDCTGSGGYSDIAEGVQAVVSNGNNDIIATSELGEGKADKYGDCIFQFSVKNVPYSKVYQFEVSHRGKIIYSHDKLKEKSYKIELSLGD